MLERMSMWQSHGNIQNDLNDRGIHDLLQQVRQLSDGSPPPPDVEATLTANPMSQSQSAARCWACVLLCGAVLLQTSWWSLYSDLGQIGGAMVLVGALGFECGASHSARWRKGDISQGIFPEGCCRGLFYWICLLFYAFCGAGATLFSQGCPATGGTSTGYRTTCDQMVSSSFIALLFILSALNVVRKDLVENNPAHVASMRQARAVAVRQALGDED